MRTFSLILALLFMSHLCLPSFGMFGIPVVFAADPAPPAAAPAGGSVFQGGGLKTGIGEAQNIQGVSQFDLRTLILNAINTVATIIGVLAAASIIICGILLIFSFGDETAKEKAKKGVLYSVIGLLVLLFAKAIVTFITQIGS